jgi:acetolactate synthase-1/2/3 large subunit
LTDEAERQKIHEMNGARSLVETLLRSGSIPALPIPEPAKCISSRALDQSAGMRCVLGLQENVVTGMADGYYRMAGKPACTLLHCGPGLANGLGTCTTLAELAAASSTSSVTRPRPPSARCPLDRGYRGLGSYRFRLGAHEHESADVGGDAAAAVQAALTVQGRSRP